jgi:Tat protein translocase TatB subunit
MLDFGFSEVVVTSMIALVVLGPKRLPGMMRRIGNWMGRARVMARQLTEQLEREINAEEILRQTNARPPPAQSVPTQSVPTQPACIRHGRTHAGRAGAAGLRAARSDRDAPARSAPWMSRRKKRVSWPKAL